LTKPWLLFNKIFYIVRDGRIMNWLDLEEERIRKLGTFLKKNAPKTYYDFSFEKPDVEDINLLTNYIGAVIALDYRFWRLEKGKFKIDYYAWRGKQLKGANFLWTKSQLKLKEDPSFFATQQLANLSKEDFRKWLKDTSGSVPFEDADKRYSLIQNFGQNLLKVGSIQKVYELVEGSLKRFVYFMEGFDAYSDFPFYKKAHLLCKIMERIGKWKMIEDSDFRKIPPIDYHLMNMAWKLGILRLPSLIEQKLSKYELLPPGYEFVMRFKCAKAYLELANLSGLDPYKMDDIMWMESRKKCQKEPYKCPKCLFDTICPKDKTGFPLVETHRY
jgi:hypothetical protein